MGLMHYIPEFRRQAYFQISEMVAKVIYCKWSAQADWTTLIHQGHDSWPKQILHFYCIVFGIIWCGTWDQIGHHGAEPTLAPTCSQRQLFGLWDPEAPGMILLPPPLYVAPH